MRIFKFIVLVFVSAFSHSQTMEKFSIDSGGAIINAGDLNVMYTIGETYVGEVVLGGISISGGFINPIESETLTASSNEILDVKIFPNPVKTELFVELNELSKYFIYDITGNMLKHGELKQGSNSILLTELTAGVYVFRLVNKAVTRKEKIIVN